MPMPMPGPSQPATGPAGGGVVDAGAVGTVEGGTFAVDSGVVVTSADVGDADGVSEVVNVAGAPKIVIRFLVPTVPPTAAVAVMVTFLVLAGRTATNARRAIPSAAHLQTGVATRIVARDSGSAPRPWLWWWSHSVTAQRSFSDTMAVWNSRRFLGAVAHRGGVIVDHETLRVGVVQMVSRTSGLQITVVARRPADRRSTAERQAAIRAGEVTPIASRVLLPSTDEGMELRLGWLDSHHHARWEYPHSSESSSGGAEGQEGPSLRATFVLPPLSEAMTLLLAWPEIGFPETSIELPLPDAATVERASISIWDADLPESGIPSWSQQVTAGLDTVPSTEEVSGTVITQPRTLHRSEDAALVLTWLSATRRACKPPLPA